MGTKFWILLSAVIYILINPYLEINNTHLFSEFWTGHARLHNAWQLISNASLSVIAIGLYRQNKKIIAVEISLVISVSFLVAYSLSGLFQGTMLYADGREFQILGLNPSLLSIIIVVLGLIYSLIKESKINLRKQND